MLAHLLYSFVTEEYPQVFYQNLSKKSQGSLFVSLFNFQGPLPLKERAFCILPHHRRFVNTFFSACPVFCPYRFLHVDPSLSACTPFGLPSRRVLDHSIKPPPFCQYLFPPFSPSLYTPPRVARATGKCTRLIAPSHHRTSAME